MMQRNKSLLDVRACAHFLRASKGCGRDQRASPEQQQLGRVAIVVLNERPFPGGNQPQSKQFVRMSS